MSRPVRIDIVDGWYHVMSRGIERRDLFTDDRDRSHFVSLLAECVGRHGVRLHAYVLMDNHYHLLVQTPNANLSRAAQWLSVANAVWFNRRHRWSSYPAYVGRAKRPDWLTCEELWRRAGRGGMALWLGRRHCGLTLAELGAAVGNASAAAVGSAVRRMDRLRQTHAGIRKRLAAAEVHLTDNET